MVAPRTGQVSNPHAEEIEVVYSTSIDQIDVTRSVVPSTITNSDATLWDTAVQFDLKEKLNRALESVLTPALEFDRFIKTRMADKTETTENTAASRRNSMTTIQVDEALGSDDTLVHALSSDDALIQALTKVLESQFLAEIHACSSADKNADKFLLKTYLTDDTATAMSSDDSTMGTSTDAHLESNLYSSEPGHMIHDRYSARKNAAGKKLREEIGRKNMMRAALKRGELLINTSVTGDTATMTSDDSTISTSCTDAHDFTTGLADDTEETMLSDDSTMGTSTDAHFESNLYSSEPGHMIHDRYSARKNAAGKKLREEIDRKNLMRAALKRGELLVNTSVTDDTETMMSDNVSTPKCANKTQDRYTVRRNAEGKKLRAEVERRIRMRDALKRGFDSKDGKKHKPYLTDDTATTMCSDDSTMSSYSCVSSHLYSSEPGHMIHDIYSARKNELGKKLREEIERRNMMRAALKPKAKSYADDKWGGASVQTSASTQDESSASVMTNATCSRDSITGEYSFDRLHSYGTRKVELKREQHIIQLIQAAQGELWFNASLQKARQEKFTSRLKTPITPSEKVRDLTLTVGMIYADGKKRREEIDRRTRMEAKLNVQMVVDHLL